MLRSGGTPFLPVYEIELASTILYNSREGTVVYVWGCVSSLLLVLISVGTCAYHNIQGTKYPRKPNSQSYLSPGILVSEPSLWVCRLEIFFSPLRSLCRAEVSPIRESSPQPTIFRLFRVCRIPLSRPRSCPVHRFVVFRSLGDGVVWNQQGCYTSYGHFEGRPFEDKAKLFMHGWHTKRNEIDNSSRLSRVWNQV